jgi:hypothetical protein
MRAKKNPTAVKAIDGFIAGFHPGIRTRMSSCGERLMVSATFICRIIG